MKPNPEDVERQPTREDTAGSNRILSLKDISGHDKKASSSQGRRCCCSSLIA